jgi:hypothetical protein
MKKIITTALFVSAFAYAKAQNVQVLDRCESLGSNPAHWYCDGAPTRLNADHKEGTYSVSSNYYKPERLRKIYEQPFNTGVTKDNGYLAFWLFVEKPELLNGVGQIVISSLAAASKDALNYNFSDLKPESGKLNAGWNQVIVSLKAFKGITGNPDLSAINYFRVVFYNNKDEVSPQEFKIDNICFSSDKTKLEATAK